MLAKITALVLGLVQLLLASAGVPLRPTHIEAQSKPVNVFVAGLMGFGEMTAVNFVVPYWGVGSNLPKMLEEEGYESYAASVGPLSSAWDRACELYAQLCGGTVDYGAAHAEKCGHARFGRTYEKPLFAGWSAARPINLWGHSFGGPTVDLFTQLCAQGSAEERAATPAAERSPLFDGGLIDRIHSVTALAAPFNGTTADVAMRGDDAWSYTGVLAIFAALGSAKHVNGIYDVQLDQFGLSLPPGKGDGKMPSLQQITAFAQSGDNALSDLSIAGARRINDQVQTQPGVYYFSYNACITEPQPLLRDDKQLPPLREWKDPVLALFAAQMGLRIGKTSLAETGDDPLWLENDGAVPVASARYPFGEPHLAFAPGAKPAPGIWNVMPTLYGKDHGYFCGADINNNAPEDLKAFYLAHMALLEQTYN
ncbi:MAG: hypothetical protein LBS96_00400 [Oscillospiraceae bacterium]|jgi:triacylglycerol lipase|nr:hypothetical protein [Oscillospiraceae bacterium]